MSIPPLISALLHPLRWWRERQDAKTFEIARRHAQELLDRINREKESA